MEYEIDQWISEIKLAEQELIESFNIDDSLSNITNKLNVYSEAIVNKFTPQQRVQRYLNKVTASTQKVWNNWKAKCGTRDEREFLFSIAESVKKFDSSFRINNCPTINMVNLQTVKVIRFNYDQMKDDLHQKRELFVRKYYPKLVGEKNIYTKLRKITIPGYSTVICNKRYLISTYNFCSRGFYNIRTSIEDDLKTLNQSIEDIQNMVNNLGSNETPVKNESTIVSEEYLSEALPNPFNRNKPQKMSFTDRDGETVKNNQKIKDNSGTIVRDISRYISLSADILSSKMRVLNEVYRNRYQILKHFSDLQKKKPKIGKEEKVTTQKIEI